MNQDFQNLLQSIRNDFTILQSKERNKPLIYLDSAATTQKPKPVIDAISSFYLNEYATVHRGVYNKSQKATTLFQNARIKVKEFLNANNENEIVFTKGTTDAINLLAHSISKLNLENKNEVLISQLDHHSNIVPWQIACKQENLNLKIIPLNNNHEIDIEKLRTLITEKTRCICIPHISNVTGAVSPVEEVIQLAKKNNAYVIFDGAQSIAHMKVDMQTLGCDFFCFSAHKLYGPTGIGVLYGKEELLNQLPPYQTGGSMIDQVSFKKTTYLDSPLRFEAGTPPISQAIGLAASIDYVSKVGFDFIETHNAELVNYTFSELEKIKEINIISYKSNCKSLISFTVNNVHPHDISACLNNENIAVRVGHHCAQPLMSHLNIEGTIRISFGIHSTIEEVDVFIKTLKKAIAIFKE